MIRIASFVAEVAFAVYIVVRPDRRFATSLQLSV